MMLYVPVVGAENQTELALGPRELFFTGNLMQKKRCLESQ